MTRLPTPAPGDLFAPGDIVQCITLAEDLDDYDVSHLRLGGVYTVRDGSHHCLVCGGQIIELCEPPGFYDARRFRLLSRPDPEVKAESMEVSEPRPLVEAVDMDGPF